MGFVAPKRTSATAIAGAFLLPVVALAIAASRCEPILPVNILRITQIASSIFFLLIVLRQCFASRSTAGEVGQTGNEDSTGLLGLVVALSVVALAYARTLSFFFACDDFDHLTLLRAPFLASVWPQFTQGQAGGGAHVFYRPLGFASLFLEYRLWHAWSPGYHFINLLLHLLCVLLVFVLCRELELTTQTSSIAALLFGILPVNAQCVTWITCRFDLLASVLMLGSLVFAARFRKSRRGKDYAGAIALFFVAAFTKESAYVLPFLWLALELFWLRKNQPGLASAKKLLPMLGYVLFPALAFLHRWYVLGGLGGYAGDMKASKFDVQSVIGVLVRAPGAMLLGNNTFQGRPVWLELLIVLIVATTAAFLGFALLGIRRTSSQPVIWFGLLWMYVSILPAHFYFKAEYTATAYTRVLYFASAGLAILLAALLSELFPTPRMRGVAVCALSALLIAGLEQNISAWQWASDSTRNFLSEIKGLEPSPAPNAAFHIANVPEYVRGVPFFYIGLEDAVRFAYQRPDLHADELRADPASYPASDADVFVSWQDPRTQQWTALGAITDAKAVRLR